MRIVLVTRGMGKELNLKGIWCGSQGNEIGAKGIKGECSEKL